MSYRQLKQLTIIWIAVIILGSISPIEIKEAVGTETRSAAPVAVQHASHLHQVMHIVLFGVGAVLLTAVSIDTMRRVAGCLALIALGCSLEWFQYIALGSECLETWDMRDDAIAVVGGFMVASFLRLGAHARSQVQWESSAKP